jgi:hypothetical protein
MTNTPAVRETALRVNLGLLIQAGVGFVVFAIGIGFIALLIGLLYGVVIAQHRPDAFIAGIEFSFLIAAAVSFRVAYKLIWNVGDRVVPVFGMRVVGVFFAVVPTALGLSFILKGKALAPTEIFSMIYGPIFGYMCLRAAKLAKQKSGAKQ